MPTYDITWSETTIQTARFDLDKPLPPGHGAYRGDPHDDARDHDWNRAGLAAAILDAILDHDGPFLSFDVEARFVTDVTGVPPQDGVQAAAQQAAMEAAALDIHVNDGPNDPEPGVVIGHCADPSRPLTSAETRHLASLLLKQADHLDATLPATAAAAAHHERRGA